MSPAEAIAAGSVAGLTVVGGGTMFIRHLVTKWLENVDSLPDLVENNRRKLEADTAKLRAHAESELAKMRTHVDITANDVRRYAEHEFEVMRSTGHQLQNRVGVEIGVLTNRVQVAEKAIEELKDDVAEFREDLHRVDSNVILIASKVGVTPLMPGTNR